MPLPGRRFSVAQRASRLTGMGMAAGARERGDVSRFELLASAIAGRRVTIERTDRRHGAWTDGATIFVDPDAPETTPSNASSSKRRSWAPGVLRGKSSSGSCEARRPAAVTSASKGTER